MHRAFRLSLALSTGLLPMAVALPAFADQAPATYTKKTIAVYQPLGDPNADELVDALNDMGRFQVLAVPTTEDGVGGFIAKVRSASQAAGTASSPAYVFTSRYTLGSIYSTPLKSDETRDKATNQLIKGEVYGYLKCPLYFNVEIYEAASGKLIKQLRYQPELERKYMYTFTGETTTDAHRLKREELDQAMLHDLRMGSEVMFRSDALNQMRGLIRGSVIGDVRRMDEFALAVGVSGWDARNDKVFFGLGQDLKVRTDDSFKVFQDGREVGFLKVRQVGKNSSSAQPIFMDAPLRVGDKVQEYHKQNWWNAFKGGMVWMGGPGFMASYDGDLDVGSAFGLSEFSLSYHGAYLTNGKVAGVQGELGLSKKWFSRRWGFGIGPRFGYTLLSGGANNASAPGLTIASTLQCYLTPDIVWSTELGLTAYTGIDPTKMGITSMPKGAMVNPLGPVAQTGFTFVF